jgi:hypothetical protein
MKAGFDSDVEDVVNYLDVDKGVRSGYYRRTLKLFGVTIYNHIYHLTASINDNANINKAIGFKANKKKDGAIQDRQS